MTAPADSPIPTKVLSIISPLFTSFFFFYYWQLQLWEFTHRVSKNEYFLTFRNSFLLFTNMLL